MIDPRNSHNAAEPSNPEAEAALLGAMLNDAAAVDLAVRIVAEPDFSLPLHRRIFSAVARERQAGRQVNAVLLRPEFEDDPDISAVGGVRYLMGLQSNVAACLAAREIAEQVRELAARRRLRARLDELRDVCSDPSQSIELLAGEVAAAAEGVGSRPGRGKSLPLEWAGDVSPVLDGLWLIRDWLPASGTAALYGAPGCGKTFLALSMAVHVAERRMWSGRHVDGGLVLYVVAEGQRGFRNRVAALLDAGELSRTAPFAFIPSPIDLFAPDGDTAALIGSLHDSAERAGCSPALIVIDTLSKTLGAGKENTDDLGVYLRNCQSVASAFSCLTLIIHHTPKDGDDLRGHSSLRGGLDTAIHVEPGVATTRKQKDGEEGQQVSFTLDPVVLGVDAQGDEVTTCLVRLSDQEPSRPALDPLTLKKRKLKGHGATALRVILTACEAAGEVPPAEIPSALIDRWKVGRAVKVDVAADTFQMEVAVTADKKADTVARTWRRELVKLKDAGILGSWGEWMWIN